MINRDSNNSIIRTNIFSKSVGGRKKKNRTLKKRKGGFSLFGDKPCQLEQENLNNKRKYFKKEARKALFEYREQFEKLLNKLKEETKMKCSEYKSSQKYLEKEQEMRKAKKKFSLFDRKLKYVGGSMIQKFKKELAHQDKLFNSHLHHIIKEIYHKGGADSDYCASVIKEYQTKVAELKKKFELLMHEYAEKQIREPIREAISLYNQCVLQHNEGDVEVPITAKPRVAEHKISSTIDDESKKLFASMISGPEYVNGKVKKSVIVAPNKPEEKKDGLKSFLSDAQKYGEEYKQVQEAMKQFVPQQQKGDNKNDKVDFGGKTYTQESVKELSTDQKKELKKKVKEELAKPGISKEHKGKMNKLNNWIGNVD